MDHELRVVPALSQRSPDEPGQGAMVISLGIEPGAAREEPARHLGAKSIRLQDRSQDTTGCGNMRRGNSDRDLQQRRQPGAADVFQVHEVSRLWEGCEI